jgi:hypothetical protein
VFQLAETPVGLKQRGDEMVFQVTIWSRVAALQSDAPIAAGASIETRIKRRPRSRVRSDPSRFAEWRDEYETGV